MCKMPWYLICVYERFKIAPDLALMHSGDWSQPIIILPAFFTGPKNQLKTRVVRFRATSCKTPLPKIMQQNCFT